MHAFIKKATINLVAALFALSIPLAASDLHPRNFTSSKRISGNPIDQSNAIEFLSKERIWYRKVEAAIKLIPIPTHGYPEPFLNQCKEVVKKYSDDYFKNASLLNKHLYAQVLKASIDEVEKREQELHKKWLHIKGAYPRPTMEIFRIDILKIYNFYAPKSEFEILKSLDSTVAYQWKDFDSYWKR